MLTRLEDKYPLVEIILTLGSTILASLPLITHTFLCLLLLITWVEKLIPDLQNIPTNPDKDTSNMLLQCIPDMCHFEV